MTKRKTKIPSAHIPEKRGKKIYVRKSKTKRVYSVKIRLDKELRDKLLQKAKASGQTLVSIVMHAVAASLPKDPGAINGLDLAKKLGIVGCSSMGPADLSTNEKYMEGFGID